uniref:START domain-containing protein n=1 Tax=Lygus hesperus TaxID=30085 RepID=A0A0A9WRM7_LYGHE
MEGTSNRAETFEVEFTSCSQNTQSQVKLPYPVFPDLTDRQLHYVAIVERNLPMLIELCDYSYRPECWKHAGTFDGVDVQNFQLPGGEVPIVSPSASILSRGRKIIRHTPDKMMALLWQTETKPLYDMMVQYCKSAEIFNNHCKIERQLYKGFRIVSNRMLTLSAGWSRILFNANPDAPFSSAFYDTPVNLEHTIPIRDATLLGVYDKVPSTTKKTRVRDEILNDPDPRPYMQLPPSDSFPTHTDEGYEYTRDGYAMVAVSVNWVAPDGVPEVIDKNIVVADLKIGGFFIRGVKLPRNPTPKKGLLNLLTTSNPRTQDTENHTDDWIYGSEIVGIGAVNLCGRIPQCIVNEVSKRQASAVNQVQKFLASHASEIREEFLFA